MKLQHDDVLEIESSSNFKTKTFEIKASREAFQILSSGLYQDKVAAVIRELSTNALDGHIQAELGVKDNYGNWIVEPKPNQSKLPFDITLPTKLSPVFKVRDYGVGLSEDDIFNIYTTYFGSSKQGSNDMVGGLGLGSKSPFSMVSSFLVISYYNGIQKVYSALIGEDGFPSIVKLNELPTTQPNGVEVNVTVNANDVYTWHDRAAKIYAFFDVKPNMKGHPITIPDIEYTHKGNGWGIREKNQYLPVGIIQGQICYSVSTSSLQNQISEELLEFYSALQNQLDLIFNIGDVEIQASREALSYTKYTIKAIEGAISNCRDELETQLKKDIETATSYVDAVIRVNKASGYINILYEDMIQKGVLKWKGRLVHRGVLVPYKYVTERIASGNTLVSLPNMKNSNIFSASMAWKHPRIAPPFFMASNGARYNVTSTQKIEYDYDPKYPGDTWAAFKQTIEGSYLITPRGVETDNLIVYNDAKIPEYKLRKYVLDTYPGKSCYIVAKGEEEFLKTLKATFGYNDHLETKDWDVDGIEQEKAKKTYRIFEPKPYTKNNYYSKFYASKYISDILGSNLDNHNIKYYIRTEVNAFNFVPPFIVGLPNVKKTYGVQEILDIFITLQQTGLIDSTDRFVIVSKGQEEIFNLIFPKIKYIDRLFDNVRWNKLPANTQKKINELLTIDYTKNETSFDFYSSISSFYNFLATAKDCNKLPADLRKYFDDTYTTYDEAYRFYKGIQDSGRSLKSNDRHTQIFINFLHNKFKKNLTQNINLIEEKIRIEKDLVNDFPIFTYVKDKFTSSENYRGKKDDKIVDSISTYIIDDWNRKVLND